MSKTLVKVGSGNSKTGKATVTYRTQDSCPPECPLFSDDGDPSNGCYAKGRIFGIPARLGVEDRVDAVLRVVQTMPMGGIFRANVSGDILKNKGTELDQNYVDSLSYVAQQRPDTDVFSYTHAWRRDYVKPDIAPGVTMNASCETAEDIEQAAAQGWPTVVTDMGGESSLIGQTIAGRKVVQCPAQTKGLTCEQCRLCARPNRKSTVAFVVHGSGSKIAARQVAAAREGAG